MTFPRALLYVLSVVALVSFISLCIAITVAAPYVPITIFIIGLWLYAFTGGKQDEC